LTPATIAHFGLGYHGGRGPMRERICIPLHNAHGEFVAYAGRDPGGPRAGTAKDVLPPKFWKSLVVSHLHPAQTAAAEWGLMLTEGYCDVMRLHRAGYANAVAVMGTALSAAEAALLLAVVGNAGHVGLLFAPDDAGQHAQSAVLTQLARVVSVQAPDPGRWERL
jgi:DNA primase